MIFCFTNEVGFILIFFINRVESVIVNFVFMQVIRIVVIKLCTISVFWEWGERKMDVL